ncbi:MAG TPA: TMEM175 family protein [Gaiellaceae bacterium]|nr:TMEM175 family protein [Gaiellaceae bacterium]
METNRVEAFSDGVFAIAITLLILAVGIDNVPHGDLGSYLTGLWPAYLAYAASFLTIGIMWVNHHLVFRQFARVDGPLLLLNVLLLMLIAFVPFPTRVVAEFARSDADRRDAALLYGLTMTITAICFFALWFYGSRHVLHPNADPRVVSGITRSYLPGVPIYGLVTVLALVNATASLILFGLIAAFYALAAAVFSRTPAMAEATAASGDSPL